MSRYPDSALYLDRSLSWHSIDSPEFPRVLPLIECPPAGEPNQPAKFRTRPRETNRQRDWIY